MSRYIMIHRLRGPAILLLIGVLALLHQSGILAHFWRLFWPLLLILIGLLLLAERAALAEEGYPMFPGMPYQGMGNPGAGPAQQPTGTAGTAIVPSDRHDFGNDVNGGRP